MEVRMNECNSATYVILGLLLPYSSRGLVSLLNFCLKFCGVDCKTAVDIGPRGAGLSCIVQTVIYCCVY